MVPKKSPHRFAINSSMMVPSVNTRGSLVPSTIAEAFYDETARPLGSYTARRFLRSFRSSATSSATAEAISEVLDVLSSPTDVLVSMYVQKTAGVVSIG